MAIGADYARIVGLVARYATITVVVGAIFGLAGAYGLARVLESRLFGVEPLDPASYLAATLLLTTVSLIAAWAPARSAARVDPVVTLRHE